MYKPLQMDSIDFCLHVNQECGKAFIWFECLHFQLICSNLTDDFTEVTREYSVHYEGLLPPLTRETQTYFERDGKKYPFTAGTSSYFPNQSKVFVFDDYHGGYTDLGDPCIGDKSNTAFNSQISCVLKVPGAEKYIACADCWNPQCWVKSMAKQIISGMERHFKDYQPDDSSKEVHPLPDLEIRHKENTSISCHVCLPVEWEDIKPVIRWKDEWKV